MRAARECELQRAKTRNPREIERTALAAPLSLLPGELPTGLCDSEPVPVCLGGFKLHPGTLGFVHSFQLKKPAGELAYEPSQVLARGEGALPASAAGGHGASATSSSA